MDTSVVRDPRKISMRGYCCDYHNQEHLGTWDGPNNYAENTKVLQAEAVVVSSLSTGNSGDKRRRQRRERTKKAKKKFFADQEDNVTGLVEDLVKLREALGAAVARINVLETELMSLRKQLAKEVHHDADTPSSVV